MEQSQISNATKEIDLRIKQLSYSSNLLLHTCPRKYQLYKLQASKPEEDSESSVTFAFGHVVGLGVQLALQGLSKQEILWQMFLFWKPDLLQEDTKRAKSIWLAVVAVEKFIHLQSCNFLEDYELVYYNGKPAVELGFAIHLPDGFVYRGYVDAVLSHKVTGAVLVLECKTSSSTTFNPVKYKNSAQAIGYSIVLDVLFPELSSYEVRYLEYGTKGKEWVQCSFEKTYLQRALWIRELLLDVEVIKLYEEADIYPMHGESCMQFYKECHYLNTCTLSTSLLTDKITEKQTEEITKARADFDIQLTLDDLIQSQLSKV